MVYYSEREKRREGEKVSAEAYELLSMLMRYVFVLIGALIVWRSYRWLRRDAKTYQRQMRSLPDAGLVGEMVNLNTGTAQPLPREGTIGSSRECDIRVKDSAAKRQHARFEFEEGKGLKIIPGRRSPMLLSGIEMNGPGYALHGTQLQIGSTMLRVRLFAGLKVPQPAAYPDPDAVLSSDVYLEPWDGEGEASPVFPDLSVVSNTQEEDYVPYSTASVPQGAPLEPASMKQEYDGHYTDDGQMTWQYAYSLDELRSAMQSEQWQQAQPTDQIPDTEEQGLPYQSPLQPRRKRRSRHE